MQKKSWFKGNLKENKIELTSIIPQKLLLGICRCDKRQTPDKSIRGINNTQAFTLIELLVVVLIIGILAAVALPQYQKAVIKSRYTQAMVVADAVQKAQEVHFLAEGSYSRKFEELDIEFPTCTINAQGTWCSFSSGFVCLLDDGGVEPCNYCNWVAKGLYYFRRYSDPSYRACGAIASNNLANEVCKSMGGVYWNTWNNVNYYKLP